MAAPTEQPPRKLSGKRTAKFEHLERGALARTPKETYCEIVQGRNSQVHVQMGHIRRLPAGPQLIWIVS